MEGHPFKPAHLSNLGRSLRSHFNCLGELSDLESSISNLREAVELTREGHPYKPVYLSSLGLSQQPRFKHLGQLPDLVASIYSFKAAAEAKSAYPHQALVAAHRWAEAAYDNGDLLSALDGYRTALHILPKVAWLGLNAHSCQAQLIQAKSENLACLAANCAIQLGCLEEAIEPLDLGRSVFWQQA
jgi:tetratricopeptide (TPR) repeat protein